MSEYRKSSNQPNLPHAETQEFHPQAALDSPLLGKLVGNYHILALIGCGGHGAVYKARDIRLGRTVALKMLRFPEDRTARDGLLREAQVLAQLGENPGIVQIHGWGEFEENAYFALEFFESNAEALLSGAPEGLPVEMALNILGQCADALAFAHARGILHRDIKPANILVDPAAGRAKLCDFGLARFYAQTQPGSGSIAGSPAFMAPEQIRGGQLSPASDVFAFGVTLYHLLCGQLPFAGSTRAETTSRILAGEWTPLKVLIPGLLPELEIIVDKCLAPNPSDRYGSAADLAAALQQLRKPHAEAAPRSRFRSAFVFGAALLALLLGAVLFPVLGSGKRATNNVAAADARNHLERGEYAEASDAYHALLEANPGEKGALYGLGYALLMEGHLDEADLTFAKIGDATLSEEGRAAVAQARNEAAGEQSLRSFLAKGGSAFGAVLLASSEMAQGRFQEAHDRLAQRHGEDMEFDWQRARFWQTLGQAAFKTGDLAGARNAFEQASKIEGSAQAQVARDYLEMTQHQLAQAEYEQLSTQISRIKTLRDELPLTQPSDTWTSRPLRLWIPPATAKNAVVALSSGLADVLPWKLSRNLLEQDRRLIDVVDRNFTAALLTEQELSAQLSSSRDAVQLGGLLGARLALLCNFNTVLGEESLAVTVVDIESTRAIPVKEFPLDGTVVVETWAAAVSDAVLQTIARSYPLRGRILPIADGLQLNIGLLEGVKPGMKFHVMAQPARDFALPGIAAVVDGPLESDSATVRMEGDTPAAAPQGGWYVEEFSGEAETPNA
ncbi:MAG: protein kinase [Candidatus Hydrogenedentes bacterium]|nr:protein kinase [Candidatus Hydrogenedentota bacterium]